MSQPIVSAAAEQILRDANAVERGVAPADASDGAFASLLQRAADAVVQPQAAAQDAVRDFTRGADGELHSTMLAQERADITMRFFVSLRNRALDAYHEVMRLGT